MDAKRVAAIIALALLALVPPVAMAADNGAAVTGSASARSAFAIWLNKESVIRALSVASAQAVTRVAGTRRESGKQPDHAK